jgi:ankyrin repeat protein
MSLNFYLICPTAHQIQGDYSDNSIVHAACKSFIVATDAVKYLLENYKQSINLENKMGMTPLHLACCRFDDRHDQYYSTYTFFRYLTQTQHEFKHDNIKLLKTLLQHDPSLLNMQTHKGETPLHIACSSGNTDAVEVFLSIKDYSVNKRDKFGNTDFHYAADEKRSKIIELLWQHDKSQINRRNKDGNTALHLVCSRVVHSPKPYRISRSYDAKFTRYLDDNDSISTFTELVNFILQRKCSQINMKYKLGRTSLHFICINDFQFEDYSWLDDLNEIFNGLNLAFQSFISNQHCSVTEQDNFGCTALHYAAYNNHFILMEILLHRDHSLLHMKNMKGKTALHIAQMSGNTDTVLFLTNIDYSLNFRENICNLVIHYAAWKKQIDRMELLKKLGNRLFKKNKETISNSNVTCFKGLN